MRTGTYKGNKVKVYEYTENYIIEFSNGSSITVGNVDDIIFDEI